MSTDRYDVEMQNMVPNPAAASSPSGVGTTPIDYGTSGKVKNRGCKLGVTFFCFLLFAAVFIIGFFVPGLIENAIRAQLKKDLAIDETRMKPTAWHVFHNLTSYMDYAVWNVTNLKSSITAGDPLNLYPVRVRFHRYPLKINITYPDGGKFVSYKVALGWDVYPEDAYLLQQNVVVVNSFYLGGMASIGRSLQATADNGAANPYPIGYHPTSKPVLNEANFILGFLSASLVPTIQANYLQANSTLLVGFRFLSLGSYFRFANAWSAAVGDPSLTWQNIASNWAAGTPRLSVYPTMGRYFAGFELPLGLSNPSVQGPLLLNTSASTSTTNLVYGVTTWFAVASDPKLTQVRTQQAYAALKAANGLTDTDMGIILTWAGGLTQYAPWATDPTKPANRAAYLNAVSDAFINALGQLCTAGAPGVAAYCDPTNTKQASAAYSPSTWEDFGALQWGTGVVAGLASSALASSTTITGFPYSTTDLLGPSAGLGGNINLNEPMEFLSGAIYHARQTVPSNPTVSVDPIGAACMLRATSATNPALRLPRFTIAQAKNFLGSLTNGQFANLAGSLISVYRAAYAPTFNGINAATGNLDYACGNATNTIAGVIASQPTVQALFGLYGINANNFLATYSYLWTYLGHILTGQAASMDDQGITPQNSGLFVRVPIYTVLFGGQLKFSVSTMVMAFGYDLPKMGWDNVIKAADAEFAGRETWEYTGRDDLDYVGHYDRFTGLKAFQYYCDYVDPYRTRLCSTYGTESRNNWAMWNSRFNFSGITNVLRGTPPMRVGKLPENIFIWVEEIKRSVPFVLNTSLTFKGVKVYKYTVIRDALWGNLTHSAELKNDDLYWTKDAPDGLVQVATTLGGAPAYVGYPHFLDCDPAVSAPVRIPPPDWEAHSSWIEVEPLTGLSLRGYQRLQSSFRIRKEEFTYPAALTAVGEVSYYSKLFRNYSTIFVPYYYADRHDQAEDDEAEEVKHGVDKAEKAEKAGIIMRGVFIACGAFFGLLSLALFLMYAKK